MVCQGAVQQELEDKLLAAATGRVQNSTINYVSAHNSQNIHPDSIVG